MKTSVLVSGIALLVAALVLAAQGFRAREGFQEVIEARPISQTLNSNVAGIAAEPISQNLNSIVAGIAADYFGTSTERASRQYQDLRNAVAPAMEVSSAALSSVKAAESAFQANRTPATFAALYAALRSADPVAQDTKQNELQQEDIASGIIQQPITMQRTSQQMTTESSVVSPECPPVRNCSAETNEALKKARAEHEKKVRADKKTAAREQAKILTDRLRAAKRNQDNALRTQRGLRNSTTPEARALLVSLNQMRDAYLQMFDDQKRADAEAKAEGFSNYKSTNSIDRFFNGGRASAMADLDE